MSGFSCGESQRCARGPGHVGFRFKPLGSVATLQVPRDRVAVCSSWPLRFAVKWRQFEPEVILLAVGWYLRFSLSYRDVEELLAERGLHADHVTVWRWVQRYAPEMERRLRSRLKPTNGSWRVDETCIRVKGKWVYLYRAVDSSGATIDFLLSAKQDAAAAKRFLAKALSRANHPTPRVINTDKHGAYPPAIVQLKDAGVLAKNCQRRPVQYLNNVLEQDHRAIKRRVRASQHFRSFWGASRTIAGYEAIHITRERLARRRALRGRPQEGKFAPAGVIYIQEVSPVDHSSTIEKMHLQLTYLRARAPNARELKISPCE